ncbi:helix-turn-helix domain-containing protein [Sinomonas atrocyanea]
MEALIKEAAKAPLTSAGSAELDWLRGVVHLAAGNPAKAEAVLSRSRRPYPLGTITLAAAAIARNAPERALAVLSGLYASLGPDALDPWDELRAGVVRAAALSALGHAEEAKDAVAAAVVTAGSHGLEPDIPLLPAEYREPLNAMVLERYPQTRIAPDLVPPSAADPALTPRELVVLREFAQGDGTTAEIAERLNVSANTVKSQTKSLFRKLGVSSRAEAVAEARRLRLLD